MESTPLFLDASVALDGLVRIIIVGGLLWPLNSVECCEWIEINSFTSWFGRLKLSIAIVVVIVVSIVPIATSFDDHLDARASSPVFLSYSHDRLNLFGLTNVNYVWLILCMVFVQESRFIILLDDKFITGLCFLEALKLFINARAWWYFNFVLQRQT